VKLVVTEKNDAAEKIAALLGASKPKKDKVYNTPVYRFTVDGEEWVTIGLRGHILEPDFTPQLVRKSRGGWKGVTADGETVPANIPDSLPKPPFKKKKPFTVDGVDLKGWKMEALPYLVYAPIEKLPKEKDIIRSLKNLAKKADSVCIATDFDREGELIGADALSCIKEVNDTAPVTRARYSAFTKEDIWQKMHNPAPETGAALFYEESRHILLLHAHDETDEMLPGYYKLFIDHLLENGIVFDRPEFL
jgi:DNA topoisomerase-1